MTLLVSSDGLHKFLGVPTFGLEQKRIMKPKLCLLELWKLTKKVQAIGFDTKSVNTGHFNGVCVLEIS